MTDNLRAGDRIHPLSTDEIDATRHIMDHGEETAEKSINKISTTFESSDDEASVPLPKNKKRLTRFSESDSENGPDDAGVSKSENSDSETTNSISKKAISKRSRILRHSSGDEDSDEDSKSSGNVDKHSDDSDSNLIGKKRTGHSRLRKVPSNEDSDSEASTKANKNEEQQIRMKNKKNKLKNKFKSLLNSREKDGKVDIREKSIDKSVKENSANEEESDQSNDEISSIDLIKQKIKERSASIKLTICDPDSSDEDSNINKKVYKSKPEQKRTKMISPKPQRMSAKEAMENMQKIKSESNRMLREREVSLPYHRPKALSLQDIMKRRKPALSSDGKALPIKMNEEQLKQYALLLEERQKEMMELCKSESEEEEEGDTNNLEDKPEENEKDTNNDLEIESTNTSIMTITSNNKGHNAELSEDHCEYSVSNKIVNETADSILEANIDNKDKNEEDFANKSGDLSAEIQLVYNDSVEDTNALKDIPSDVDNIVPSDTDKNTSSSEHLELPVTINTKESEITELDNSKQVNSTTHNTEVESQLISLHYDSEKVDNIGKHILEDQHILTEDINEKSNEEEKMDAIDDVDADDFPDDDDVDMNDINMEDIDSIIENAELRKDIIIPTGTDSPALVRDVTVLNVKPKLTGAPGMVIDLDGTDPIAPRKLTGVELLKERFTFFAKLKTPEELERAREKREKPGTQHLKLKQELENIIAEQRSLEWSKRLENEKLQHMESDITKGDNSDDEDDIDKIEAKLEENEVEKESSSEGEEDENLLEDDVVMEDKPKMKNPLVDDEAEESDVDEDDGTRDNNEDVNEDLNDDGAQGDDDGSEEESSDEEESSESEDEGAKKPKKGRILKAFEDSDDEDALKPNEEKTTVINKSNNCDNIEADKLSQSQSYGIMDSQDVVIQLAQIPKQLSSDVFTSQGSAVNNSQEKISTFNNSKDEDNLGTQTFSILNTTDTVKNIDDPDMLISIADDSDKMITTSSDLDGLNIVSETQPYSDDNLDAVVGMCSGNFQTQNCIEIQPPSTQTQTQSIGEDLLNMCTGKFYDNEFVSPNEDIKNTNDDLSQDQTPLDQPEKSASETDISDKKVKDNHVQEGVILKSVLEELKEPDFESAKPLKFFSDGKSQNKENEPNDTNSQVKKRFVIESDDETNDNTDINKQKKKKKLKKKKLEQRALQISDDEEEYEDDQYEEDDISENEDDKVSDDEGERLVEYDSEENEVVVKPQIVKKKKRKATEFFEQEAELTSEDEWVGSGDEDEAGLDRMEREDGDDETFHQGQLQRELGQIHMRDVLDQDKREVRLIQELLFEDGDLGGGGRQRKFRWRNADGEEETGTVPEEFADTQEEEFESEEQWRKQRHEREMFLRQMKNAEKEDDLNVSVNRTTIIKANLCSRTMSSLLEEVNQTKTESPKVAPVPEKKTTKDIPSPVKKPFTMFQQNYHGSLLTRGQGALARLAALATPLAADDDAPKIGLLAPSNKRNFVFAAVTPEDKEPKVTKRKAENNIGTPRLVKKMKTEEKQNRSKSSLLEFLKS